MKQRVLIVDDHAMMRDGLRRLLLDAPDVEVVGDVADGRTALDLVRTLSPTLVVMDVGMPELNGVETTRRGAPTCALRSPVRSPAWDAPCHCASAA